MAAPYGSDMVRKQMHGVREMALAVVQPCARPPGDSVACPGVWCAGKRKLRDNKVHVPAWPAIA